MNVALVHLPGLPLQLDDLMPRRSCAVVAAALAADGHRTQVFDFGTPDAAAPDAASGNFAHVMRAEEVLRGYRPAMVIMEVTRRKDLPVARSLARFLRQDLPGISVLVMGDFSEAYGEVVVCEEPAFDAAVLLDPEVAVVEAARQRANGEVISGSPNMVVARGGVAHRGRRPAARSLDDLPMPDYSPAVYPSLYQGKKLHVFELEHCRGGAGTQMGPTAPWSVIPLRVRSASVCVREIEHIRKFAPSAAAFHVSGAATPASAVEHLCYELRGLERPMRYSRDAQVPHFDTLSAHSLFASGCRVLHFTVHSGSQRLLEDFYGQSFKVSEAERALQRAQRARLFRVADFTFPVPKDDRHTHAETLRLLSRTMPEAINVNAPELRPESTWRDWQDAYGFGVEESQYRDWVMSGHNDAPYSMDGWNKAEAQQESDSLLEKTRELGIGEGLNAREALMAKVLELDERLDRFALLQREALLREDTASNLVRIFNERAGVPASTTMWFPFQPQLRAVSN